MADAFQRTGAVFSDEGQAGEIELFKVSIRASRRTTLLQFARRLALAAATLLGAVGSYFAIQEEGWIWVVLIGLVALAIAAIPYVVDTYKRLRNYARIEGEAADAIAERDRLRALNRELAGQLGQMYEAGMDEGRREVIGSLNAAAVRGNLKWIAVAQEGGELAVLATIGPNVDIPIGSRFEVQSSSTGNVKGTLEVVHFSETSRRATLRCVRRTIEDFWRRLEEQIPADENPPTGVRLVPADFSVPVQVGEISPIDTHQGGR